jgi:hypothetical protein
MQPPKAESVPDGPFAADVNAGTAASDDFTIGGIVMKKMLYLLSLGIVCSSLALAQDASAAGQTATPGTDTSAGGKTVQGCLSGGDGNYLLTEDGTGATYKLVGDETQLKKHMGHEVAVTGQSTNDTDSQAPASDQGQAQPSTNSSGGTSIQVTNVKMISKQCQGSTNSAPQQ